MKLEKWPQSQDILNMCWGVAGGKVDVLTASFVLLFPMPPQKRAFVFLFTDFEDYHIADFPKSGQRLSLKKVAQF